MRSCLAFLRVHAGKLLPLWLCNKRPEQASEWYCLCIIIASAAYYLFSRLVQGLEHVRDAAAGGLYNVASRDDRATVESSGVLQLLQKVCGPISLLASSPFPPLRVYLAKAGRTRVVRSTTEHDKTWR